MANSKPNSESKYKFLEKRDYDKITPKSKVTIVGLSETGIACASCIIQDGFTGSLCYIDLDGEKLNEKMHGFWQESSIRVTCTSDISLSADSDVCVITIQSDNQCQSYSPEECLSISHQNLEVYRQLIPKICEYSPNSIIFVISRPTCIMTYTAWKLSKFPRHRVIGLGTCDTNLKFRYLLAKRFNIAPSATTAYLIGLKSQPIPVWNTVAVGGVRLKEVIPNFGQRNDNEKWYTILEEIKNGDREVGAVKNKPSWSCAFCCANIVRSILSDNLEVYSLNTYSKGLYGIDKEIFLSFPCCIGRNGVTFVMQPNLNEESKSNLDKLADITFNLQTKLEL